MTKHFYLLLIFFLILINNNTFAQFASVQDGDWDDCNTWNTCPGSVQGVDYPGDGDAVTVSVGTVVTVDNVVSGVSLDLTVEGELFFVQTGGGGRMDLDCPSSVTIALGGQLVGGGSGNNNRITFGGTGNANAVWSEGDCDPATTPGTLTCNAANNGPPVDSSGNRITFCNSSILPACSIPPFPTEPDCPSGAGTTEITESAFPPTNITLSDVTTQYYINDPGITIDLINLSSGSSLIICSDVTISQFQFNNNANLATIIVKSGAQVEITNNAIVTGALNFINYGDLTFNANLELNNNEDINIVNATSTSRLEIGSNLRLNNPNVKVYSNANSEVGGKFEVNMLGINSNASENAIVLGDNATLDMDVFDFNNQDNSICSSASCASINIGSVNNNNNPISANATVLVCDNSNPSGGGSLNPGSATRGCPATCNTPLPITLLNFEAKKEEDLVEILWSTGAEFNNEYFAVERSKDGFDFYEIERIQGAGNYTGLLNYSAVDANPLSGQSYYRLKQVDFDGTFTYSKVVSIFLDTQIQAFQVYPSSVSKGQPLSLDFSQQSEGEVNYEVYDVLGRSILTHTTFQNEGRNTLSIPTAKLKTSHYFVRIITADGEVNTIGFIVK